MSLAQNDSSHSLQRIGEFDRPTPLGVFHVICYEQNGAYGFAVLKGKLPVQDLMVRVQSPCLFGESFLVNSCDCGAQLTEALRIGAEQQNFLLVYLTDQEGRGHGMFNKIKAIQIEVDHGIDMVEAFGILGLALDIRNYKLASTIIRDLNGDTAVRLLTNNPKKVNGLEEQGLRVSERLPLVTAPTNDECLKYLTTKRDKMGHFLPDFVLGAK